MGRITVTICSTVLEVFLVFSPFDGDSAEEAGPRQPIFLVRDIASIGRSMEYAVDLQVEHVAVGKSEEEPAANKALCCSMTQRRKQSREQEALGWLEGSKSQTLRTCTQA